MRSEAYKARARERRNLKYANDPEFRARRIKCAKVRAAANPEQRKAYDAKRWRENKEALKAYKKVYTAANQGKIKARRKAVYPKQKALRDARRREPSGWLGLVIPLVRSRAARRGIPFEGTAMAALHLPDACPLSGEQLAYGCAKGDRSGPSIDRIVPSLGYVAGNMRVISLRANMLRQDCTDPALFRALADDAERILGVGGA